MAMFLDCRSLCVDVSLVFKCVRVFVLETLRVLAAFLKMASTHVACIVKYALSLKSLAADKGGV